MRIIVNSINRRQILSQVASISRSSEFEFNKLRSFHKVVWVNGCFDLLHCGHLRTIRLAASAGDCLIIGLNSDFSVRKLKGFRRPIIDEMNRARALSEIPGVNFVLIFNEESPLETLKKFEPQIVVKGAAYSGIEFPEKEYLESIKCEIRYLPQLKGISSTEIERQILRADEKDF